MISKNLYFLIYFHNENILNQSVSICPSDDDPSDSEDSELESLVDILSSELQSEVTVFKISSLQITFHFFNFLMSEIHIKMQIRYSDILQLHILFLPKE